MENVVNGALPAEADGSHTKAKKVHPDTKVRYGRIRKRDGHQFERFRLSVERLYFSHETAFQREVEDLYGGPFEVSVENAAAELQLHGRTLYRPYDKSRVVHMRRDKERLLHCAGFFKIFPGDKNVAAAVMPQLQP